MIRKLLKLKNVGLFSHACEQGAVKFEQATLIYAENGRGKSTLASAFRSCTTSDSARLAARQTIDKEEKQELELLRDNGVRFGFDGTTWSGNPPNFIVFDSEFVEENVYSGFAVRTDQKQALLGFVLGREATQLKRDIERLTVEIQTQTAIWKASQSNLDGLASPMPREKFEALAKDEDAETKLAELQNRLKAAKNIEPLKSRKDLLSLKLIELDVGSVFDILSRKLDDIEESAFETVTTHIAKHNSAGIEGWLNQGQGHITTGSCPFCDQGIESNDLISAYRSYFNKAYKDFKAEIRAAKLKINEALSDSLLAAARSTMSANTDRIQVWEAELQLAAPAFDLTMFSECLSSVHTDIAELVEQKSNAPLEKVGSPQQMCAVIVAIAKINQMMLEYNAGIEVLRERIASFRDGLAEESVSDLERKISTVTAQIKRHSAKVLSAYESHKQEQDKREELIREKQQVRDRLDKMMNATLSAYQKEINTVLCALGAGFVVGNLRPDYTGSGEPSVMSRMIC